MFGDFFYIYDVIRRDYIWLANRDRFWKFIWYKFRIKKYVKDIYLHLDVVIKQHIRRIKRFGIIHKHRQIKLYV